MKDSNEEDVTGFFTRKICLSLVIAALIGGAIGAVIVTKFKRPGIAVVKSAARFNTVGAIVAGKKEFDVINTLNGKRFLDCSKEKCRSKVVVEDGDTFLVDRKTGKRIDAAFSDIRTFRWKGSHCEASSSSGVHRESCCTSIFNC